MTTPCPRLADRNKRGVLPAQPPAGVVVTVEAAPALAHADDGRDAVEPRDVLVEVDTHRTCAPEGVRVVRERGERSAARRRR